MSIIRGVEVDIENQLDNFKASHKEERGKLKYWTGKAAEAARQIAERDGGWACMAMPSVGQRLKRRVPSCAWDA